MENTYKTIFAFVSGVLTYLFGHPDIWLWALLIVVVTDYVTGLCKAFILGKLSSTVGFKGIVKKMMYFAIVAVAVIADSLVGANGMLRVAVIGFLIANEALSILENCAEADLPVPPSLIKVLEKIKDTDRKGR